jgi:hypothetical protein
VNLTEAVTPPTGRLGFKRSLGVGVLQAPLAWTWVS